MATTATAEATAPPAAGTAATNSVIPTPSNAVLATSKTPPRTSYAASAHHTPIASIKRPRSSLESNKFTSPAARKGSQEPPTPARDELTQPLSPMHPPRAVYRTQEETVIEDLEEKEDDSSWVGRKVDALFSPVLSFLNHAENAGGGGCGNGDTAACASDDAMVVEDEDQNDAMRPRKSGGNHSVSLVDTQPTESTDDVSPAPSMSNQDEDEADIVRDDVDVEEEDMAVHVEGKPDPNRAVSAAAAGLADDDSHCESLQAVQDETSSDAEDEFNPWQFIKALPDYKYVQHLCPPVALLPKDPAFAQQQPLTLVLDLDETLVHCTIEQVEGADLKFPVQFHGVTYTVHVRLRPHLFTFLQRIQGLYEVIVFTASQKVYANELLNLLDPDGVFIHHRLFRESCLAVEGNFLKDLNVLGRDLTKTILVDNSPHAFGYQVDNGIPIESWFDDPNDKELLKLEKFLRQLRNTVLANPTTDVRTKIRDKFQCHSLISAAPGLQD